MSVFYFWLVVDVGGINVCFGMVVGLGVVVEDVCVLFVVGYVGLVVVVCVYLGDCVIDGLMLCSVVFVLVIVLDGDCIELINGVWSFLWVGM